jgi:hypothetical protein
MKTLIVGMAVSAVLNYAVVAQTSNPSKNRDKPGYESLFDGKTTNGWHTYLNPAAGSAWKVVNGTLLHTPQTEGEGDLVTDNEYENFELSVDWNIAKGGNSGIIFGVHEDPTFQHTYETGIEMQVLDNINAGDNKKANHLAGSLYDMKAPLQDAARPYGEWNTAVIRKQNGHLTFWLNNVKIVETQMGGDEWQAMLDASKFKTWKNFGIYAKGHIALQAHGAEVSFRNINIKQL